MKKLKWLRKLSILALALIIAVMPLTMAAPAHADVLSGSEVYSARIFFDAFDQYFEIDLPVEMYPYFDLSRYKLFIFVNFVSFEDVSLSISAYALDRFPYVTEPLIWHPFVSSVASYSADFGFNAADGLYVESWFPTFVLGQSTMTQVYWLAEEPIPLIDIPNASNYAGYYDKFDLVASSSGDGILSVFTGVGSWLSGAVQNISTMFWTAESGMSVLGYLAVASLALAVILLIFYLIAGWLKFH